MGSSYYITYGGNRLTFPGSTGSVAWEDVKKNMTTAWIVGSPSARAYGYAYDGSTLLTSWNTTGSASAEIPINSTFKISSVANTYIRNGIAAPTGLSSTAYVATKTRYQTASGKTTGGSAVLSVNSVQKAAFTAYGTFPSAETMAEARNRYGHWMPHQVTSVSPSTFINAGDVSANYAAEYRLYAGTWESKNIGSRAGLKTGIKFSGISAHALATARKNQTNMYNQFNLFISNKTSTTVNQSVSQTSTRLTLNVAYNAAAVNGTTAIGTNPISLRNSAQNGNGYAWWEAAKFTATGMVP